MVWNFIGVYARKFYMRSHEKIAQWWKSTLISKSILSILLEFTEMYTC